MNSKKIIIYDNLVLFKILDEIKENLNFDLINCDRKNLKGLTYDRSSNLLILAKENIQVKYNLLILKKFPITLKKFIQLINIQFLKNSFNSQSDIRIGSYKINMNSREMIKDNSKLKLTEREINLMIFLSQSREPVKIEKLQKEVWEYNSELETHTVETHIYRLRKKIKDVFNDEHFILSLKNGYSIN